MVTQQQQKKSHALLSLSLSFGGTERGESLIKSTFSLLFSFIQVMFPKTSVSLSLLSLSLFQSWFVVLYHASEAHSHYSLGQLFLRKRA
jgi:hypothetical protein